MLGDMAEGSGGHYYNEEDQFSDTEPEYEEGSGSGDGMGKSQSHSIQPQSTAFSQHSILFSRISLQVPDSHPLFESIPVIGHPHQPVMAIESHPIIIILY